MVDLIIHQMWFDRTTGSNTGPPDKYPIYKMYAESWRQHHSDYEYVFWNGDKLAELWAREELAQWRPFYSSLRHHIEKCDYSRYAILYLYGGLYVDLDYHCLKSFTPLLSGRQLLLFREPREHEEPYYSAPLTSNSLMASARGHPLWKHVLDYIKGEGTSPFPKWLRKTAVNTTGPKALHRAVQSFAISAGIPPRGIYGDTCDVMPFVNSVPPGILAKQCSHTRTFGGLPVGAYAYTLWGEGTNWFATDYFSNAAIAASWLIIVLVAAVFIAVAIWPSAW